MGFWGVVGLGCFGTGFGMEQGRAALLRRGMGTLMFITPDTRFMVGAAAAAGRYQCSTSFLRECFTCVIRLDLRKSAFVLGAHLPFLSHVMVARGRGGE